MKMPCGGEYTQENTCLGSNPELECCKKCPAMPINFFQGKYRVIQNCENREQKVKP